MSTSLNEVEDLFVAVVKNTYPFAKITRSDEYAVFNHFDENYLKKITPDEQVEVAKKVFFSLEETHLDVYFWLLPPFNIKLWQFVFDLLKGESNKNKKKAALNAIIGDIDNWSKLDCDSVFSATDKKLLLNEALALCVTIADDNRVKLG